MTDDELAKKLEFYAKRGIHAHPPLLYAAAERLYALSALCALLKASLAQAEREAEKATASAEPFGYFRVTPFGWEDCAETDEGATPLYERAAPAVSAEPVAWLVDYTGEPYLGHFFAKEPSNSGRCRPLYTEPQPDRVAELEAETARMRECLLWLQARHNGGLMRAKIDAALAGKEAQS